MTAVASAEAPCRALFLGSPRAEPALVVGLSERYTPRAQDVVCGDGVEIEVGQRKGKDEGFRGEGQSPRADLKVQVLARPAVDLVRREPSSAVSALPIMARRSAKGTGPANAGGLNLPVFTASSPHTEWCQAASIWK